MALAWCCHSFLPFPPSSLCHNNTRHQAPLGSSLPPLHPPKVTAMATSPLSLDLPPKDTTRPPLYPKVQNQSLLPQTPASKSVPGPAAGVRKPTPNDRKKPQPQKPPKQQKNHQTAKLPSPTAISLLPLPLLQTPPTGAPYPGPPPPSALSPSTDTGALSFTGTKYHAKPYTSPSGSSPSTSTRGEQPPHRYTLGFWAH